MKIGILTFHRASNYGAFLQAYALSTTIANLGHEVEMIDYWPKYHSDSEKLIINGSLKQKIKNIIAYFLTESKRKQREKKFETLRNKFIRVGKEIRYIKPEDLTNIDCDIVVYGSDQIWWKGHFENFEGYDGVYWGEYINEKVKKITYAPSMGIINIGSSDIDYIKSSLKRFSAISVREDTLKKRIKDLTEKPIEVVLDPTFLLKREQWENLCTPRKVKGDYLLLFNLSKSKETEAFAKDVSNRLNLKIVEVTGSVMSTKFGLNIFQTESPFEFLSLIKNASFVITSSFHGTAFSILMKKQFYSTGFGKNGGRAFDLLSLLGLEDRYFETPMIDKIKTIDYTNIAEKIDNLSANSYSYLRNNLS